MLATYLNVSLTIYSLGYVKMSYHDNLFSQTYFSHPTWNQHIIDHNTRKMKKHHRDWRSQLSSYVDGKKKGEDPTLKWHYMKKEHWDQFVRDHTTPEALVSTKTSIILNILYVFPYVFFE